MTSNTLQSFLRFCGMSVLAVALAIGLAACDAGSELTFEQHMNRAQQARADGSLRETVLELRNALKLNPESAAARYMLGQVYIDLDNGTAAESELERAQQLGMRSDALLVLLSRAWLLQGEYRQVLDQIRVSSSQSGRVRAALNVVRGDAHFGMRDMTDAVAAYRAALKDDPGEVLAHVGLGNVALRAGRNDEAREFLDSAVKIDDGHLSVITLRGDIQSAEGNFDDAVKSYGQLVAARPGNVFYRTVLAWAHVNLEQNSEALEHIDRVLAVIPDYPPALHIKAVIALRNGQFAEARDHATRALAIDDGRTSTLLILGAATHALGNQEQAYNALRRYVASVPNDRVGRQLLSQVQLALGRGDEALETLAPLLEQAGDDDRGLFDLVAQASLMKGDLDTGRTYLERSVKSSPGDSPARMTLGRTQIAMGQVEEGLEELERAVELAPGDYGRRMILALEYLRAGETDKALDTARAMQDINDRHAAGYTLEGLAMAVQGERVAAVKSFEKALEVDPGNPNASMNLIRMAVAEEDWKAVRRLLDGVLERDPGNQKALLAYADLEVREGDPVGARQYLEKAVARHPEAREPSVLLARNYFEAGNYTEGLEVARKIQPLYPRDPALLELIGNLEIAADQDDNASVTFRELVEARPNSPLAHFRLGLSLERQGNMVEARRSLEQALEMNPGYTQARFALSRVLAEQQEFERAEAHLVQLTSEDPDQPEFHENLGVVAAMRGKYDIAVPALERALALRPNSVNVRRLAEVQARAKDMTAAERTAGTWLEEHPDDHETRFFLGGLYFQTGQRDAAEQQYRHLMENAPENPAVLNNLAYILGESGRVAEGLKLIQRAVRAAPDNANILATAGRLYLKAGQPREAVSTLRRASDVAPRDVAVQRLYVDALVAANRKDEARSVLSDLLDGPYEIEDRGAAEALYLELTSE